jgi:hypothetical protein
MTDLTERIAALPPWAKEVSLGGLGEEPIEVDLQAALARLALARDMLQRFYDYGYNRQECRELLAALEGPK